MAFTFFTAWNKDKSMDSRGSYTRTLENEKYVNLKINVIKAKCDADPQIGVPCPTLKWLDALGSSSELELLELSVEKLFVAAEAS